MSESSLNVPEAATESSTARSLVPRPISVWLMIVALSLCGAAQAYYLFDFLQDVFQKRLQPHPGNFEVVLVLIFMVAVVFLCVAGARGLHARRRWSRWLGLILFGVELLLILFDKKDWSQSTSMERVRDVVINFVLIPLLLCWWASAFGFSSKSKRYFGLETERSA